jgi:type IV pilus assembly protein PilM
VIKRNYLGLDIGGGELKAVSLRRKGKGSALAGGRVMSLDGDTMKPSVREANVLDMRRFADALHEVLDPLAGTEDRLGLSLPDAAGRILLTEVETAFKSKDEGVEILKWHLKNNLPVDGRDIQLDYQVLERSESGRYRLVVGLMARKVLEQFEELILQAGYSPVVIDFHSLNLHNYYRLRLDLGDNFVLVGIEGHTLALQYYQGQALSFHRSREVGTDPGQIFQELSRSLVGCQEDFASFRRANIFVHSDWQERESLMEALKSAFSREEIYFLDPHLERLSATPLEISDERAMALIGAVGVAERMM